MTLEQLQQWLDDRIKAIIEIHRLAKGRAPRVASRAYLDALEDVKQYILTDGANYVEESSQETN